MSTKKYDYIVFIGRFQGFHQAHLETLKLARQLAKHVFVVIGSSDSARSPKNPFTAEERRQVIWENWSASGSQQDLENITIIPISDFLYNDSMWVRQVVTEVQSFIEDYSGDAKNIKVGLIGKEKDDSSFYLKMFPQWDFIDTTKHFDYDMNATDVRNKEYGLPYKPFILPEATEKWLWKWRTTEQAKNIIEEAHFYEDYKKSFAAMPYPPTFVTVDAVVVKSGHILLIQRKHRPGKGLWALPGGFLNQKETLQEGMIRELREETRLKVPVPVLVGNIKAVQVFDHPQRSLRGRTITHAHLINLGVGELPEVRANDDAKEAKWFSISEITDRMADQLFEDHLQVILHMLGKL